MLRPQTEKKYRTAADSFQLNASTSHQGRRFQWSSASLDRIAE